MSAPAKELSVDEKMHLITRNLQEVMGGDVALEKLRGVISQRPLKIYWGTATTGAPHIAYFVPMSKLADFLRAGCEVTILFADLHAYLDNMKSTWDLLQSRTEYYERVIKEMLKAIGVSIERLNFVRGTTYQLSREYSLDMYKLTTITTERNAKKAGAEVVKQTESPCLSGMLYPLLQALDEEYLHCDAQFGGVDQRKIFTLAEKCLPAIGYAKRVHLMNPMVPGLAGSKMSSSDRSSKIDLLDSADSIAAKLKTAFCPPGIVEENGVLSFVKMVLFAVNKEDGFTIRREEKHGGDLHFKTYADLEAAYIKKDVFPLDLKNAVLFSLNQLLNPIREAFAPAEMQALIARAYPKDTGVHEASTILDDDEDSGASAALEKLSVADGASSSSAAASSSKPSKAAKPAAASSSAAASSVPKVDPNAPNDVAKLDIKIGRVLKCELHPRADKLYISQIDVGEAEPRQVVSGLREFIPIEEMQNRLVCVLINMKPTNLVGEKSHAMVLAASSADHTKVELLTPPEKAKVGERVTFAGFPTDASVPELARASEKALKVIMPELKTSKDCVAMYKGVPFMTSAGEVKVKSLAEVAIA